MLSLCAKAAVVYCACACVVCSLQLSLSLAFPLRVVVVAFAACSVKVFDAAEPRFAQHTLVGTSRTPDRLGYAPISIGGLCALHGVHVAMGGEGTWEWPRGCLPAAECWTQEASGAGTVCAWRRVCAVHGTCGAYLLSPCLHVPLCLYPGHYAPVTSVAWDSATGRLASTSQVSLLLQLYVRRSVLAVCMSRMTPHPLGTLSWLYACHACHACRL